MYLLCIRLLRLFVILSSGEIRWDFHGKRHIRIPVVILGPFQLVALRSVRYFRIKVSRTYQRAHWRTHDARDESVFDEQLIKGEERKWESVKKLNLWHERKTTDQHSVIFMSCDRYFFIFYSFNGLYLVAWTLKVKKKKKTNLRLYIRTIYDVIKKKNSKTG